MKEAAARAKLRRGGARAAQPAGRRALPGQGLHAHARAGAASASTSTARSPRRSSARATGNILAAHGAQPAAASSIDEDIKLDIAYNHRAISRMVKRISSRSTAPRATPRSTSRRATSTRRRRPPASTVRAATLRTPAAALAAVGRQLAQRQGPDEDGRAEGHLQGPRREVPGGRDRPPRRLQALALQATSSSPSPTGSRSAASASRRPRGSTTCRTRRSTRPGRCRTRAGSRRRTAAR